MHASALAPAASHSTASGMRATARSCVTRYSACAPPATSPVTRSPTCHRDTPGPTAATVPANSSPGMSAGAPGGAG